MFSRAQIQRGGNPEVRPLRIPVAVGEASEEQDARAIGRPSGDPLDRGDGGIGQRVSLGHTLLRVGGEEAGNVEGVDEDDRLRFPGGGGGRICGDDISAGKGSGGAVVPLVEEYRGCAFEPDGFHSAGFEEGSVGDYGVIGFR